jgi:hypothetical protein
MIAPHTENVGAATTSATTGVCGTARHGVGSTADAPAVAERAQWADQSHNAGVAGSSPAPAIALKGGQRLAPIGVTAFARLSLCLPPQGRATTTATKRPKTRRFRFQFRAARRCRYEQCYRLFTATARDLVFCSARCGRAARGYDESGKRLARGAA